MEETVTLFRPTGPKELGGCVKCEARLTVNPRGGTERVFAPSPNARLFTFDARRGHGIVDL